MDEYRLPKEKSERQALLKVIGQDGQQLLDAIEQAKELSWLKEVPAVKILKEVWEQQYIIEAGQIRHREIKEMPVMDPRFWTHLRGLKGRACAPNRL